MLVAGETGSKGTLWQQAFPRAAELTFTSGGRLRQMKKEHSAKFVSTPIAMESTDTRIANPLCT
jgi:hypothetical protein